MNQSQPMKKPKGRGRGILSRRQPIIPGPPGKDAVGSNLDSNSNNTFVNIPGKPQHGSILNSNNNSNNVDNNDCVKDNINHTTDEVTKKTSCIDIGEARNGKNVNNIKNLPSLPKSGMIAKFNFKANQNQPGGFPELSIKQGEPLVLLCKGHTKTQNNLWWEVRNEKGEEGFVPANYCLIIEEKVSALPWLENKRLEDQKAEKQRLAEISQEKEKRKDVGFGVPANYKPPIKQYVSSYAKDNQPTARNTAEANKEFYCELCDKNLNGPQPYRMHMSSKAHKEEVEYQRSKNQS